MYEVTVSKNDMRKDLARTVARMRGIRKELLSDNIPKDARLQPYREQAGAITRFAKQLENRDISPKVKELMTETCLTDEALRRYDPSQDGWWLEGGRRPEFLTALWMFSAHILRSAFTDPEDAFHIFQITKMGYEPDRVKRDEPDFVMPAYGGIPLPLKHLGPLLASMTGNSHLVPLARPGNLVLELDWYPDDSGEGTKQVTTLMDAATKLGFSAVEFRLIPEYKYEGLYGKFHFAGGISDNGQWNASIPCRRELNRGFEQDSVFHPLEFEEKEVGSVNSPAFLARSDRFFSSDADKGTVAAGTDASAFASRLLFFTEKGHHLLKGGFYFFRDGMTEPAKGEMDAIALEAGKLLQAHVPILSEASMKAFLGALSEMLSRESFSWQVAYATLKDRLLGGEDEVEGFEGSFR